MTMSKRAPEGISRVSERKMPSTEYADYIALLRPQPNNNSLLPKQEVARLLRRFLAKRGY